MTGFSSDRTAVGVDGCKGGWIAVSRRPNGEDCVEVFPLFDSLLNALAGDAIIAVDMPIGLPALSARGGRGPEALVRRLIGARQSSVFAIPSREAVYASPEPFTTLEAWYDGHRHASATARATSDPPRGVSIQAFGIFDKIRELDRLLIARPNLREQIIESHPEVAFRRLNGETPLMTPKKIKGRINPEGMAERRALLAAHGIDAAFLARRSPPGAFDDDFLDAACMMLVALRRSRGEAVSYPSPPGHDEHGIPVAIWA